MHYKHYILPKYKYNQARFQMAAISRFKMAASVNVVPRDQLCSYVILLP